MRHKNHSKPITETPFLDKILSRHMDFCSYWIFSGDRHCSCGRDKALEELEQLKSGKGQMIFQFSGESDETPKTT